MYKRICITNRHLIKGDFLACLDKVLSCGADMLILREKDLSEAAYEQLLREVLVLCASHHKICIPHTFVNAAKHLSCRSIHLTMKDFRNLPAQDKTFFTRIGVSAHSIDEIIEAAQGGASYATISPIFSTDCKKGVPAKGLSFLKEAVQAADIDVYALGGITQNNIAACIAAGAAGVCQMSAFMNGDLH